MRYFRYKVDRQSKNEVIDWARVLRSVRCNKLRSSSAFERTLPIVMPFCTAHQTGQQMATEESDP